eukprot:2463851-Lingulodinium_polyedra.AAC.1
MHRCRTFWLAEPALIHRYNRPAPPTKTSCTYAYRRWPLRRLASAAAAARTASAAATSAANT